MKVAQLRKSKRTRVSKIATYAAPTGGWNTQDPRFSMPSSDCWAITNYYPRQGSIEKRGGTIAWATGTTGNIGTLATYSSLSGTESMFAFTGSGIFNVTSVGAVGASVLARTSAKHQWTMFGDGTNNWLCAFNGVDKPAFYNGTTWTAVDAVSVPAITGVTTTGLIGGMSYQGRLYLIEKDTLKFWYLPAGAVGGAATAFDLTAQASRGGYLSEALPFTYDGGSGLDDAAIFLTSMGEAIVYTGTDPSDATKWSKRGTYFIGKPISRKAMTKVGGDVLVATESGVVRMSSAMNGISMGAQQFYVTNKIRDYYSDFVSAYIGSPWESFCYFRENAYFVGLANPTFVMNVATGAWTAFYWEGSPTAMCFGVLNSQLYYALTNSTATRKAWWGSTEVDNSSAGVNATVSLPYVNLGNSTTKKLNAVKISYNAAIGTSNDLNLLGAVYGDGQLLQTSTGFSVKNGLNDTMAKFAVHPSTQFSLYIQDGNPYDSELFSYQYIFEDGGLV